MNERYIAKLTNIVDPVEPIWPLVLMLAVGWAGIISWNAFFPSYVSASALIGSSIGTALGASGLVLQWLFRER